MHFNHTFTVFQKAMNNELKHQRVYRNHHIILKTNYFYHHNLITHIIRYLEIASFFGNKYKYFIKNFLEIYE